MIKNKKAILCCLPLILVLVGLFFGYIYIRNLFRECNNNSDCGGNSYCGIDYACHPMPKNNINSGVMVNNNYGGAVFILAISFIIAASILKWRKKPHCETEQHAQGIE